MNLRPELITDTHRWKEIFPEWESLLERSATQHFFQTPTFLETWWETLGSGELHIVAFWKETPETSTLVGVLPTNITHENNLTELCFIGCVDVSDYLDCIVDTEHISEVYQGIREHLTELLSTKKIQSLYLCSIPDTSPTLTELASLGATTLKKTQQDVCPQIHLPSSWEAYLEGLDRKQRHEIRRKQRKLEREYTYSFKKIESGDDIAAATKTFTRLHQLSSPDKKEFWTEHHLAFFNVLLERSLQEGYLALFFLEIDNEAVSSMLGFEYRDRFYLYNSGFNPELYKEVGTGNVLTAHTIEYSITQGLKVYDFLRGDEAYKFRFGAEAQPVWDMSVTL